MYGVIIVSVRTVNTNNRKYFKIPSTPTAVFNVMPVIQSTRQRHGGAR